MDRFDRFRSQGERELLAVSRACGVQERLTHERRVLRRAKLIRRLLRSVPLRGVTLSLWHVGALFGFGSLVGAGLSATWLAAAASYLCRLHGA